MNRTLCFLLGGVLFAPVWALAADPLTIGGDPSVDPNDFRITAFATGLNYPVSMEPLSDGSLLVATSRPAQGSFFNSTGELVRLVDANLDGVADSAPQVLYSGLPGGLTSMRRAGNLVFTTIVKAGYNGINVLRAGATPDAPLTMVGSLDFTYPENWEHVSFTLATRATPGEPGRYDLAFNVGSQFNFDPTTGSAKVSGLASGDLLGDSIYLTTVQDTGAGVEFGSFTQIARGLRNAAGIEFDPTSGALVFEDNGIDGLVTSGIAHSADELNVLPADQIGGAVEDYGFPHSYYEYGTGTFVGGKGEAAAVVFQPWPDPSNGAKSEGPYEVAVAPAGFPPGLNTGVFVGFHGNSGGPINDENPLVYADPQTGKYFHFVSNDQANVGHLDGLKATSDSLFVADMTTTGSVGTGAGKGVIYQIKSLVSGLPGDVDGNLQVDLSDFGILKANFGTTAGRRQGDLTLDGKIDLSDFGLLKENFGKSGAAAVPEPSTLALMAAALSAMFLPAGRSKKRRASRNASHRVRSPCMTELLESRDFLAANLMAVSPMDGAMNVDPNSNLVLTFSESVRPGPGAGRLLIHSGDGTLVEAVDLSDPARVTFGGNVITVDPVKAMPTTDLYVTVDPGAVRDMATAEAEAVLFSEDFEATKMLDSSLDKPSLDHYALFLNGTLDVQSTRDYRFGIANDDGGYLAIDLNGDGVANIDDPADRVIFDDTTHSFADFFADGPLTLAKGQYEFEYMYFAGAGDSGGEFFYAVDDGTLPDPIVFDPLKFAVIGDSSKGIGVTPDGVKATNYVAAAVGTVDDIQNARDLKSGHAEVALGFPLEKAIATVDVWDSGNKGHFSADNLLPGLDPTDPDPRDYSNFLPPGWAKESNKPQSEPVYDGWAVVDYHFWFNERKGEFREDWFLQSGNVLVMDSEGFDDFSPINDGVPPEHDLEAYATLSEIDLTGVSANSITLAFDSSFRPKNAGNTNSEHPTWIGQTGLIDVSFDGGTTWHNALVKNSQTEGGDGSREHTNEHLSVRIDNPAGGAMLVRFGLVNAQGDWWWGVDNVVVAGEVQGSLFAGISDRTVWNFATDDLPNEGCAGDFGGDGKVDLTDFGILKANFGTGTTRFQGDANGDARVDLTDFGILKSCFGKAQMARIASASATSNVEDGSPRGRGRDLVLSLPYRQGKPSNEWAGAREGFIKIGQSSRWLANH